MEDGSVVEPDTTYTVTFTQERVAPEDRELGAGALSLSAYDGCNFLGGGYALSETGSLSIGITSSTLMACIPPPSLAALFYEALSDASSYEVQGDSLRIDSTDGDSGERSILNFIAN
jgi:heat shock protein HslJ